MNRSVAFHTLGCKLNYSETSALGRMLEADGFTKKEFDEVADVYVINTCSVTENADKECRQIVRRIQKRNPDATVVITGCYAQLKPQEIAAIEGVDLVLGAAEKFNLATHLREITAGPADGGGARICSCDIEDVGGFHSSYSVNDRTRTFLKVQDGCDYNCSFCTIPLARGHSRSDSIQGVLNNIEELAAAGVKEVVLTGINLGDFGKGADGGRTRDTSFYELIQAIDSHAAAGVERFRISSIEPNLLTDEVIRLVAGSKRFMPHFHIPLQSGSDRILGLMRRRYRRDLYADRVALIKQLMPHCCIGVDVIVGFPGETDADMDETFRFLHDLDISYLHVFTYSERTNTLAAEMRPQVPMHVRNERNKTLRNLSFQKMRYFTEAHTGATRKVLFEHAEKNGMMEGYSDNYIKVQAPFRQEMVNRVVDWTL
ncbi:tRNA (N(6)-L-threonylcarbamoyladenosine(37)-C(2))-methylthiotransferase MtaB [Nemorincola caseinilytica]|uniref:tRNA (N(6)-L-threonylcarbamoyladenosine(37)-C(2))-methylthiotransferase MtaB n=1 Tax=Nemorincola caseinilytica TaxID=2054315 RepID=A0ABP8N847_9BACT